MKVLIIRLSSFGDIIQCMSLLKPLKKANRGVKVDWVCRSDFSSILELSPEINHVWSFDRKEGLLGLIYLGFKLRASGYTHIYDAHSTIRSRILCLILRSRIFSKIDFKRRSKERLKRLLLFYFRKNLFSSPFLGMVSYLSPLASWFDYNQNQLHQKWDFRGIKTKNLEESLPKKFIVLAPSAAWPMKTWPIDHWKKLISHSKNFQFIILGGPSDKFCQQFEDESIGNVSNFAGKLSLAQSCFIISKALCVVSADTGLIHVADLLGVKGISLLGPTAFGRCTGENIKTLEIELDCRPCTKDGRGKCSRDVFQQCMKDITPEMVYQNLL